MTVQLKNATVGYDDEPVFEDVSLRVDDGELVGLLGPNGSGKTTLLRTINANLTLDRGTVALNGTDLETLSPAEVARLVGYVPQESGAGDGARVYNTVLLGRNPHFGWRPDEADRQAVETVLAALGIEELSMRRMGSLSGGQRRTVLLARALVQATDTLLLDEPTSGLDVNHQYEVMRRIRASVLEDDLAGLLAIHDLDLAAQFCDRFAFLENGTLRAVGDESVLKPSLIEEVYGVPVDVVQWAGSTRVITRGDQRETVSVGSQRKG